MRVCVCVCVCVYAYKECIQKKNKQSSLITINPKVTKLK